MSVVETFGFLFKSTFNGIEIKMKHRTNIKAEMNYFRFVLIDAISI